MVKKFKCNCKGKCNTRRCSCLKNNEACGEECGCSNCQNPLNGVDVSKLTSCAIQNIDLYQALSKKELKEEYELPCGCEEVVLELLLSGYSCSKCGEYYWYSFCWGEVVQDSCTWHCEDCNECRDWR